VSHIRSVTTAVAVLLFAGPLSAQGVATDQVAPTSAPIVTTVNLGEPTVSLAPTRSSQSVGVRVNAPAAPFAAPAPTSNSNSTALMIVGGAALLIGSAVGGNSGQILMIGGAVVGLIGLWTYLN
jgi:hypothetical protein